MTITAGRSIRLFLVDGTPGGVLTAEIMNWTGHVIAAPRSDLGTLLSRPEISRTGIYILIGDDPESIGGTRAYIGEADDIGRRLVQHARSEPAGGKDFWSRVVVLTSKDANLTKAHARYLESRLIEIAHEATRATLTNGTAPSRPLLPEADQSDMEYFIAQATIVLPLVGLNIFRISSSPTVSLRPNTSDASAPVAPASPLFVTRLQRSGITAYARELDGEFFVLKGSTARSSWAGVTGGYQLLHAKLCEDGTITKAQGGDYREFTHDQVFASPSAAAAIVLGRSANGREVWKTEDGRSYATWQDQRVNLAGGSTDETDFAQ